MVQWHGYMFAPVLCYKQMIAVASNSRRSSVQLYASGREAVTLWKDTQNRLTEKLEYHMKAKGVHLK